VPRKPRLGVAVAVAAFVLAGCTSQHGHSPVQTFAPLSPRLPTSSRPATTSPASTSSTLVIPSNGAPPGTTVVATLTSSGLERSYRLHAPSSLRTTERAPLVLVLHGASGNAARVELRYHWDSLSDQDGFFVVYPQGMRDQWNASLAPGGVDDVRFITALIDHLMGALPVDPRRVYVAGMSNGGFMTYRLGCALSGRIAAIAPVEAVNPGCRPARAVSMVAVHGLADHEVSFSGAQQSISAWRSYDGCPIDARIRRTGPVTHSVWAPCAFDTTVELYAVANSGHEWPGSSPPLAGHDPPSSDLDATQVIWRFFQQHHR
jgi:polyhydroxybutyrate depolymerase